METKTLSELIRKADLEEIKHVVLMQNNTSGTSIYSENSIKILEFKEKGIVLSFPVKSVAEKHNITLYLLKIPLSSKIKIDNNGKVKGAVEYICKVNSIIREHDDESFWIVDVEFTQYLVKEWREFILCYNERQKKMNSFKSEF